jgi:hypothetical protein
LASIPAPPEVLLPESVNLTPERPASSTASSSLDGLTPTTILASGLGWVLGGPLGAVVAGGASTIASKLAGDKSIDPNINVNTSKVDNAAEIIEAYTDAAADYLFRLNTEIMETMRAYRSRAIGTINSDIKIDRQIDPKQQEKLTDLERCLSEILSSYSNQSRSVD